MTGGGDLDEILDDDGEPGKPKGGNDPDNDGGLFNFNEQDLGQEVDPADGGLLEAAKEDPVRSAGGADVGGRAGDDPDR